MKKFLLIISILALNSFSLLAQEEPETQPLELPAYIIEGKEPINVQGGTKEFPDNKISLSKMELDSLNSLEKQQSLLLPTKNFPSYIEQINKRNGYLNGSIGRYITPSLDFGYDFKIGEANLIVNAGGIYSSGHVENADYSNIYVKLNNDYVAPSKYWIFGGSRSLTTFSISNKNYNLYADSNAKNRNSLNLNLGIKSEGDFNGFSFFTGASLNNSLLSATNNLNNFNLNGFLKISTSYQNYLMGGNAYLNFGSFNQGIHFAQLNGIFNFKADSNLSFNNELGLQFAGNSKNEEQIGFLFNSSLNFHLNKLFTLKALLSNGLENNSLENLLYINPYLNDSTELIYENLFNLKLMAYYHPDEKLSFGIGVFFGLNSNTPYFVYKNDGTFITNYGDTRRFGLNLEGNWTPTENDVLAFEFLLNYKSLAENQNIVPNFAPMNILVNYSRKIFDNLNGNFGIKYVGEKFGDKENNRSIDGFVNLFLGFDYIINNKYKAFIKLENLLNSNIFYYERYVERGLYGALGVNVIF